MSFIVLEKGIFLEDFSFHTSQTHAWPIHWPETLKASRNERS